MAVEIILVFPWKILIFHRLLDAKKTPGSHRHGDTGGKPAFQTIEVAWREPPRYNLPIFCTLWSSSSEQSSYIIIYHHISSYITTHYHLIYHHISQIHWQPGEKKLGDPMNPSFQMVARPSLPAHLALLRRATRRSHAQQRGDDFDPAQQRPLVVVEKSS